MSDYEFPLTMSVREIEVEPTSLEDDGSRWQIFIGDTILWTEPAHLWLCGEDDGQLVKDIHERVLAPMFRRLIMLDRE